ncbi:FAD-dependent oxidoreductase [Saccharothrix sp. BKS2]|uniref:NAD(P)/FAD-dependent oxidoreductase n=1 Tax=Saccharothrix sp. BKS2 TaxID=3064400 RepID=UPI0039E88DE1
MTTPDQVLVVGASAAGLATAEALRRKGYTGGLTLLGDEPHPPYDRPPLSKQVLAGAWGPERARLRGDEVLEALGARLVLGDRAVALDLDARAVTTAGGLVLRADAIVVATGVRPRTLPGRAGPGQDQPGQGWPGQDQPGQGWPGQDQPGQGWPGQDQPGQDQPGRNQSGRGALAGVHVLRTLDDALALRSDLLRSHPLRPAPPGGTRLVVVGDGVLGAEVAATARVLGLDVTLAGPQAAPLAAQLGPLVAGLLADLHAERGVRLRLGSAVLGLDSRDNRVTGVRLAGGEVLPADVVLVALGAVPNTEWLAGSGLTLDNGVVCDARCRAADGVYAVGDVARWRHERLDVLLRLENRTNATEQAAVVADNVLGADRAYAPVPYFWTDQFDARLHVHGVPTDEAEVLAGDPAARRFVVAHRRGGETVGVLGWNMPKQARHHRQELLEPRLLTGGTR